MDRSVAGGGSAFRDVLGAVMGGLSGEKESRVELLTAVALLRDLPDLGLVRGQVGTVVEAPDGRTALVEFCDDQGRAYVLAACPHEALLSLRTTPLAA
jgi:hypothetical protein